SPATIHPADARRASGTPSGPAIAPHRALPAAIPPKNTSRYTDSARARTQAGRSIWADELSVVRAASHAAPAGKSNRQRTHVAGRRATPAVDAANTIVPPATTT